MKLSLGFLKRETKLTKLLPDEEKRETVQINKIVN